MPMVSAVRWYTLVGFAVGCLLINFIIAPVRNEIAVVAQFLGGLVAVLLVSRLIFWGMKRWNGGARRILLGHLLTLILVGGAAGFGEGDGDSFAYRASLSYVGPVLFWVLLELAVLRHRSRTEDPPP